MSETLPVVIGIYLTIATVTVGFLLIAWADAVDSEKPIWPIAGLLWPILAVIGIVKAWENRHD